MGLNEKVVLDKVQKGEDLTPEEKESVMSRPNKAEEFEDQDNTEETKEPDAPESESTGIKKSEESDSKQPAPLDKKVADAEVSPSEKTAAKTDASKSADKDEISAETRKSLEKELEKPEGYEDLSSYTTKEIGLFYDLRRQRARARKAEEENESLKFERMQRQLKEKEQQKAPAPEKVEAPDKDPFEGRDGSDVLTVEEARELYKTLKAKPEAPKQPQENKALTELYIRTQKTEARITLKEKNIHDFDDVVNFAEDALGTDQEAKDYLLQVHERGGNVALATYNLVKASNKWPEIEKSIRVARGNNIPQDNLRRAEKLEENEKKVKTTGPGGGAPPTDEYTVEEIRGMSVEDFAALPKKKRALIMEKYGSNPNNSV